MVFHGKLNPTLIEGFKSRILIINLNEMSFVHLVKNFNSYKFPSFHTFTGAENLNIRPKTHHQKRSFLKI